MTIMHQVTAAKSFTNKDGARGSRKGKPQSRWPWVIKMAAEALACRAKGTMDGYLVDRHFPLTPDEMEKQLEAMLPGVWAWRRENAPRCVTPHPELAINRVQLMYYFHKNPKRTRATVSPEHWRNHVPPEHPLVAMHEQIHRSVVSSVPGWKEHLGFTPPPRTGRRRKKR